MAEQRHQPRVNVNKRTHSLKYTRKFVINESVYLNLGSDERQKQIEDEIQNGKINRKQILNYAQLVSAQPQTECDCTPIKRSIIFFCVFLQQFPPFWA